MRSSYRGRYGRLFNGWPLISQPQKFFFRRAARPPHAPYAQASRGFRARASHVTQRYMDPAQAMTSEMAVDEPSPATLRATGQASTLAPRDTATTATANSLGL